MLRWLSIVTLTILAGTMVACAREQDETPVPAELPVPKNKVVLEVIGNLSRQNSEYGVQFDMDMLHALPVVSIETHTSVTDGRKRFEGVLVRDLLKRVGADGTVVHASAINDYMVEIPISDFERFDVIIAYRVDGAALSSRDKGPLWMIYPRDAHAELQDIRYDYRWVWQLNVLEVE